ncbi:hypothetical protein [Ferrimonas aestuarii]|uniref:Uncharacterized protein n=1 Tax=Ferrimonas aestuarii TaxID=2569539 RepID=A0A4U1BSF9_9GAMM|nr:hypothetical protein [Ferrimonas aestuarii]TKB56292.1 hypothetical protein FCL42_08770 [Ferrimonas aestuarii]
MANRRRKYNNALIIILSLFGMMMLYVTNLISPDNENSYPLLPEGAQIEALVAENIVIRRQSPGWLSAPEHPSEQLELLMHRWHHAGLMPIAVPEPLPTSPVQVDLYLNQQAPITLLLYPDYNLLKLLGQEQWWRLTSHQVSDLLIRKDS